MEASPQNPQNMIDTTDALEAVSACQSMKNFLFLLILLGLFICQVVFWLNHFDLVRDAECSSCPGMKTPADCSATPDGKCSSQKEPPQANAIDQSPKALVYLAATAEPTEVQDPPTTPIEKTIDEIVNSANEKKPEAEVLLEKETELIPAEIPSEHATEDMLEPVKEPQDAETADDDIHSDKLELFSISSGFAKLLVAVCNHIILVAAVLYSLTLLVCLKISLVGRLGGINHIVRAFFVSLFLLVVLIPWQTVLPGVMIGVLWSPRAIWCECWLRADASLYCNIMMYLRFCGMWLLAIWLLLSAQGRSAKWAKATLRRLGIAK